MGYFVYLLRCENGSIYTGITTDLQRRFREHAGELSGGAKFTASRKPERFVSAFTASDRASASRLEARIKQLTRAEKLSLAAGDPPEKLDLGAYTRCAVTAEGKGAPAQLYYDGRSATCRRAKAFLDERGADYVLRPKREWAEPQRGPVLVTERGTLRDFLEAEWRAALCH